MRHLTSASLQRRNKRPLHYTRISTELGQLYRQITYDFYALTSTLSTYGNHSTSVQPSHKTSLHLGQLSFSANSAGGTLRSVYAAVVTTCLFKQSD
jgi:hypothetical protein